MRRKRAERIDGQSASDGFLDGRQLEEVSRRVTLGSVEVAAVDVDRGPSDVGHEDRCDHVAVHERAEDDARSRRDAVAEHRLEGGPGSNGFEAFASPCRQPRLVGGRESLRILETDDLHGIRSTLLDTAADPVAEAMPERFARLAVEVQHGLGHAPGEDDIALQTAKRFHEVPMDVGVGAIADDDRQGARSAGEVGDRRGVRRGVRGIPSFERRSVQRLRDLCRKTWDLRTSKEGPTEQAFAVGPCGHHVGSQTVVAQRLGPPERLVHVSGRAARRPVVPSGSRRLGDGPVPRLRASRHRDAVIRRASGRGPAARLGPPASGPDSCCSSTVPPTRSMA